ncbi:MAG: ABC transporter ATP-binding protein, partial [Clostridiales bacterium]|nr:ABC transporter ATP-binding protein [Clostridiales bacterium]
MIRLENLSKIYRSGSSEVAALKDVNLTFPQKGMVFVVGKSGSGKSTLLNLMAGMDGASGGTVTANGLALGRDIDYDAYRNNAIGFIFQEFNLNQGLNAEQNVLLSERLKRNRADRKKAARALDAVGLSDKAKKKIQQLSGGEQQRVAIARALIKEPKIVLADEPTGKLDEANGKILFDILKKLSETVLVVVVSHDRESAERYADRIIELSDGRVVSDKIKNPLFLEDTEVNDAVLYLPYHKKITQKDVDFLNQNKDKLTAVLHETRFKSHPASDNFSLENNADKSFLKDKKSLKPGDVFFLSWRNLAARKFRTVGTIFICIVMFAVLGLCVTILNYNEFQANARTFIKNNEGEIVLYQGAYNSYGGLIPKSGNKISDADAAFLKGKFPE